MSKTKIEDGPPDDLVTYSINEMHGEPNQTTSAVPKISTISVQSSSQKDDKIPSITKLALNTITSTGPTEISEKKSRARSKTSSMKSKSKLGSKTNSVGKLMQKLKIEMSDMMPMRQSLDAVISTTRMGRNKPPLIIKEAVKKMKST